MVQELFSVDTGDAMAHCVAIDKATKNVAVGCSNAAIKIINIEKQDVVHSLTGHEDAVTSLYINHDNSALYSTGNDGSIKIWK